MARRKKKEIKYYVAWSELARIFNDVPDTPEHESRVKFLIYGREEVAPEDKFYRDDICPHEYPSRSIELWWDPKEQEWTFECPPDVIIANQGGYETVVDMSKRVFD